MMMMIEIWESRHLVFTSSALPIEREKDKQAMNQEEKEGEYVLEGGLGSLLFP